MTDETEQKAALHHYCFLVLVLLTVFILLFIN